MSRTTYWISLRTTTSSSTTTNWILRWTTIQWIIRTTYIAWSWATTNIKTTCWTRLFYTTLRLCTLTVNWTNNSENKKTNNRKKKHYFYIWKIFEKGHTPL
jgi:hypothetical protein